ncbi:MAG: substrate-binding domain-containing protein [Propionivibrio sp.]|uniref:substrate-binding domain-containing protein n=1 Tax=Propionivibrio sp. TaxID=2212460 RepID=UPI001A39029D|nr:substrate-binding domain-containing protein [Propionivibrio sp.]MBL8415757.1 substrate-binding domain-containing protein [Propionivibrio sp.]
MRLKPSGTRALLNLIFAVLMTVLCLPPVACAAEIRIGGTGNALGTMRLLGEAFTRQHPETSIVILDSIGTSGALKALPKGSIEIGLSSRQVSEDESRSGLTTLEYARSPTVFAVNKKSKVLSITLEQIADLYSGKLTSWPDGTKIRPVLRQPGDDNTRQVKRLSAEIEQALAVAEKREGMNYASTDQEAADKLESTPGSIGVTTLALIRSENRNLRPLAIGGAEPSPENMNSGRYPMIKAFYFVLPKEPTPAVMEFVSFVRSPQGRKILEQNGHSIP